MESDHSRMRLGVHRQLRLRALRGRAARARHGRRDFHSVRVHLSSGMASGEDGGKSGASQSRLSGDADCSHNGLRFGCPRDQPGAILVRRRLPIHAVQGCCSTRHLQQGQEVCHVPLLCQVVLQSTHIWLEEQGLPQRVQEVVDAILQSMPTRLDYTGSHCLTN